MNFDIISLKIYESGDAYEEDFLYFSSFCIASFRKHGSLFPPLSITK